MDNHVQKQAYQFTVRFFFESLNDGTGYHTDKRGLHYAKTVVVHRYVPYALVYQRTAGPLGPVLKKF